MFPQPPRKKRRRPWLLVVLIAIGVATFWDDAGTGLRQLQQAFLRHVPAPVASTLSLPVPKAEIHAYRPSPAPQQPRQTEFNDQNYRPRTDINLIEGIKPDNGQPEPTPQQKALKALGLESLQQSAPAQEIIQKHLQHMPQNRMGDL